MKIIGIAGYSGSGKTTLIEKVIPVLVREGLKVSLVKHAHHEFDVDQPGKDSYRHRHAGCTEVLVSSSERWALMHELRGAAEPSLQDQLKVLSPCDLVLVEGYKREPIPKVEGIAAPATPRSSIRTTRTWSRSLPTSPSTRSCRRSTWRIPPRSRASSSPTSGSIALAWFARPARGHAALFRRIEGIARLLARAGGPRANLDLHCSESRRIPSLARNGRWSEAFSPGKQWRVAVNQQMANLATPLKPGDEVAFFPPVTGG
jgi:molybdopterin-guanine dinucleotide biosynthesis protein MobB